MLNEAQWVVIQKDIRAIAASNQTLVPMIIVPLVMMLILPLALIIGVAFGMGPDGHLAAGFSINGLDQLTKQLSGVIPADNPRRFILEVALDYMMPALFLLIPVMAASIIGAASFVGEKEHKTLESLLVTPLGIKRLFVAKVLGTALVAWVIALLAAVVFGLVVDIGGWLVIGACLFPNLRWILLLFWVTPAIIVLSVSLMVLVSAKAKTFQDAQQMAAFVILPIIVLMIGQTTGLLMINEFILVISGLVLWGVDLLLFNRAARGFTPEKLL